MSTKPTLLDVIDAKRQIAPYIPKTPLHRYLSLDKLLDAEVYVKHENHHRLGAFKVRGGVNLISRLSDEEKRRGVATASTGNHGQSIAFSANLFGTNAIITVPENANPVKVESIRNLGATVIFHGNTFEDAREHIEQLSEKKGYRCIHAVEEPLLIAGVGTYCLEIFEDLPDVDVIINPVGGGSGAAGVCITSKALKPHVKLIGVQSAEAPAAYLSWKNGREVEAPMESTAEGLAVRMGYKLPQEIIRDGLDDFILVTDKELNQAIVMHLEKTHNLTEHAGAASLAAAIKIKDSLKGKKVVLVMSGGNISPEHLKIALAYRE